MLSEGILHPCTELFLRTISELGKKVFTKKRRGRSPQRGSRHSDLGLARPTSD